MTRQRTAKARNDESARSKRLWLLLLALPVAALFWREYPSVVRYIKIARM
jgi:hypothetical protein